MRAQKNRGVVYTGKVGAKLKPLRRGMFSSRLVRRVRCELWGGPFNGRACRLEANGDGKTLIFTARGQMGRYVCGKWVSVETMVRHRAELKEVGLVA